MECSICGREERKLYAWYFPGSETRLVCAACRAELIRRLTPAEVWDGWVGQQGVREFIEADGRPAEECSNREIAEMVDDYVDHLPEIFPDYDLDPEAEEVVAVKLFQHILNVLGR